MALEIVKNGDVWQLPDNFHLTDIGFRRRTKPVPKVFSHGGADKSDSMIEVRYLSLEGSLSAKNDIEYDNKWNELVLKISQKDFYLRDGNQQILIHQAKKVDQPFAKGLRKRLGEIEIDLVALDPFWYSTIKSEDEETITGSPQEWNVTNNGNMEVHPIITITNNGSYGAIVMKNMTDDERMFTYEDLAFKNGAYVVIDCVNGTVKRGATGTDTIRFFSGSFLRLLPDTNTIRIEGLTNATVKHEWYRREL